MKHSIYRHSLPKWTMELVLPAGSTIIHFGYQAHRKCLSVWALAPNFPQEGPEETWRVSVVGTGGSFQLPEAAMHLGTCMVEEVVWHCFVEKLP